ncbi:hypothetical protein LOTGIDRAFT_154438 [Lottia gigantea]|uniref:SUEL-type lectin domain-containing protein n=1 Tax=Lottia gigantea TaxID=225164 RepID=V3ZY88_LOTGI|nr:hypothetical protein LOTGIDRAFT_154438 [Lottia gigantea]ESO89337.1 hypothetical protein LOTGIDRAFT_154438 [Lottia gigantea]
MAMKWLVILLYSTVLFIHITGLEYPMLSSSACYGVDLPCTSHHLQCAPGSVITIITAHYGYKQQCETAISCSKCCWYTDGDCLIEYNPKHYQKLFKSCSLQNECLYRAPWVASTLCSRYKQILAPSVYSYITYRCNEVIGMGNANENIPAITPVKEFGVGSMVVSIVCSLLLVVLLIISGVIFKLGYCNRICKKITIRNERKNNEEETPEYYECESISESVPDVISNSLYSQPYDRPSGSNTPHVNYIDSLYAKPMKKTKRGMQRHLALKGNSVTRSSVETAMESCYYLKSDLLTPYGSDVILGEHDYATIYKSEGEEEEVEDKEQLRERVSVISTSSSALVNYDRLKFTSEDKMTEFDPNYDHLKCCGYNLKICKRNSSSSRKIATGHSDRVDRASHFSSVNSNYEQISLSGEGGAPCLKVEIHKAGNNEIDDQERSSGRCRESTSDMGFNQTKHGDVCRCSDKQDDEGAETNGGSIERKDNCYDCCGHRINDVDSRDINVCGQPSITEDNDIICNIIDNEYKFCYNNDNDIESDSEYNNTAVI